MHRRSVILLVVVIGVSLLLAGKFWNRSNVDWIALYEQKLGRPVKEIGEVPLMARLEAEKWDEPRITNAKLKDGTTLLIGLPEAYQSAPEDIVERSVILDMDDAKQRCQESLQPGEYDYMWHWDGAVDEATTRFVIEATPWKVTASGSINEKEAISSPNDPYCELVFSDQWRLSMVRPVGVIESMR